MAPANTELTLLQSEQLATRRSQQATLKSADSIKRFSYLLGQTDLFRHFCDLKVSYPETWSSERRLIPLAGPT